MAYTQETTSAVNQLLEVLNDRNIGFNKAIENVDDPNVKAVFEYFALQAEQFCDELRGFSENYSPSDSSSGYQNTVWNTLKESIISGNRNAMVEASMKLEKEIIGNYDAALTRNLDPELRSILIRQLSDVKKTINLSILLQAIYFK
jgi:uncharacterized protein (TIGR02284 family)